jgi:cytochrome c
MKKLITSAILIMCFSSVYAVDPKTLAQSKSCLACHSIDSKLVGPSYKDVAAKYKNDPLAEERLIKKVMAGGGGVWGTMPMPANTQVNAAETKILVQWILSLSK